MEIIKEKTQSNAMIDQEYMLSAQKEQEIKDAFERIKRKPVSMVTKIRRARNSWVFSLTVLNTNY